MKNNFIEEIEKQELIKKLETNGLAKQIEALLMHEGKAYTKKGRLNKSGACRLLGIKPKELDDFLKKCRDIVGASQFLDD
jgi:hypothetical protein